MGYWLEPDPSALPPAVKVYPAWARHLAQRATRRKPSKEPFGDLWAVDFAHWKESWTSGNEPFELARQWLTSPGRRLMQDPGLLRHAPEEGEGPHGAVEWTVERILSAAGVVPGETPGERTPRLPKRAHEAWLDWLGLHLSVPGLTAGWAPARGIGGALEIMETGDPITMRGAALTFLLGRAAEQPVFKLGDFQQDLRSLLPASIAIAFPSPHKGEASPERFSIRLEELLLHFACKLTLQRSDLTIQERWRVARWLHQCLLRSPFFGEDIETWVARLEAMLTPSSSTEATSAGTGLLDPVGIAALGLKEVALTTGAAQHEGAESVLTPAPLPLIQALSRVALRPMSDVEKELEIALGLALKEKGLVRGQDPLDEWPFDHVSPTLLAQSVLTGRGVNWVGMSKPARLGGWLDWMAQHPQGMEWLGRALSMDPRSLSEPLQRVILKRWGRIAESHATPHLKAMTGLSVLGKMKEAQIKRVAALIEDCDVAWQASLWSRCADGWSQDEGLVTMALARLVHLAETEATRGKQGESVSLNAAYFATRSLQRSRGRLSEPLSRLKDRLLALASRSPFADHDSLRRELRRLGPV